MPVRSVMPRSLQAVLRPLVWAASDTANRLRGEVIPSRRLRSGVPGDFRKVGQEFLGHCRSLAGLRREDRVLDIGCGPGRYALPFTGYLSSGGSYEGVDTWAEAIEWCRRRVSSRFSNFSFTTLEAGEPGGVTAFPFEDATFDFAMLCSLARLDLETYSSYMKEAARLLRPGGVLVATLFLITPRGRSQKTGQTVDDPSRKIVMNREQLNDLLSQYGLDLESVYPGTWDFHPAPLSYQDLIVARKPRAPEATGPAISS